MRTPLQQFTNARDAMLTPNQLQALARIVSDNNTTLHTELDRISCIFKTAAERGQLTASVVTPDIQAVSIHAILLHRGFVCSALDRVPENARSQMFTASWSTQPCHHDK